MKTNLVTAAASLIAVCLTLASLHEVNAQEPSGQNQEIWYTYPAQYWNSQSLHLGNGFLGASFFGGVNRERFALTEGSMWKGGPFRGDWEEYGVNTMAREYLDVIRKAVVEGNIPLADSLSAVHYLGRMNRFGHFTSIGNLYMDMDHPEEPWKNYRRSLDLAKSMGTVSYELDGVTYTREYFCSYPHNVLVMKIKSDCPGSVGFRLGIKIMQEEYDVEISGNTFTISGLIDGEDKRKFALEILMLPYGGQSVDGKQSLGIQNADSVVLFLSAATDYKQEYPTYLGENPNTKCASFLDEAQKLGYKALKDSHIRDYRELYDRVGIDPELNVLPTNERWDRMKMGHKDVGLKELAFNLGRYLIISSSRPGSLPANLQGKWNAFYNPPWTGNYQSNINIQEIYWPCGPVNLIECQEPYVEWTKDLVKSGREMARHVYGTRGWISHTIGNIWGHTAPVGGIPWGIYPLAPVWHCQHLWEHYNFTMDSTYLKETAYPIMKEAAQFWLENLVDYKGFLIAAPSISAEHGAQLNTLGNTIGYNIPGAYQDAQMIGDLFKNCLSAAEILGLETSFGDSIRQSYARLLPPQIGKYGQLQEWYEDLDSPEDHHRHISHLYALCPGSDIHPLTTPELAEAAKASLNMRGEGRYPEFNVAAGGNWSMCWRIWCWTRLMDGDRANKIFTEMLTQQGFENLTTFQHAPYSEKRDDMLMEPGNMYLHFQLDGTASTPGFMAEMFLQSHLGDIVLLPALPSEWSSGSIRGLKARGGYTVDMSWENRELTRAVISGGQKITPSIWLGKTLVDPERDNRIKYNLQP